MERPAKPMELELAEMLDGMAQRYSCMPSDIRDADSYNIRIIKILDAAGHFGGSSFTPLVDPESDLLDDLPIEVADG